jgi:hypothetical protein
MGKVIFGAIVGLVLGALLGTGVKYVCEDDSLGNYRKYSRLPVYRQNNAGDLIKSIDIAPAFPTVGARLGSIVGAIAGATAAVVGASRGQAKGPTP